jgi:hypothetical protein
VTIPIESLRNLGPRSSQWLRDAGISRIAHLEQFVTVATCELVRERQPKTSLHLLWAMAAGLKGNDWRELPVSTKQRLRKEAEEV